MHSTACTCLLTLTAVSAAQAAPPLLDPDELNGWARDYFEERLENTGVPGAVLVIVEDRQPAGDRQAGGDGTAAESEQTAGDGQAVVMQGFGVTTTENGEAVDPTSTLFRVGSITKVMTAIAAQQLIDEGVIDPHADVNDYLREIRVPAKFGTAVTVEHLLKHTGGFGSELRGAEAPYEAESQLSREDIQRLLVPRVRPPGMYPAYDNNGWGLLGLVLADAAGIDYPQLIRTRVFEPLRMTGAGIGLPDARRPLAARPHNVGPAGDVWTIDYSLLTTFEEGAGDATATGADMARFMITLLRRGELDGARVLTEAGFEALTDFESNRIHPAMPGYGRSVYEFRPAGRKAIRHDGGISGFVSSMVLYPESRIGVFFSINAQPENPFAGDNLSSLIAAIKTYLQSGAQYEAMVPEFMKFFEFHEAFADKYIPAGATREADAGKRFGEEALNGLVGTYVATRNDYGVFIGNLQARLLGGTRVSLVEGDTLRIGADEYTQTDNGVFQKAGDDERYAFAVNEHGVFMGSGSLFISRKAASYETALLTVLPLVLLPPLVLTGLFYARNKTTGRAARTAGLTALVFVLALLLEAEYANDFLVDGRTLSMFLWRLLLAASTVGLAIVAYQFGAAVLRDVGSGWSGFKAALKTFHRTLVSASAAVLVVLSFHWELAGSVLGG